MTKDKVLGSSQTYRTSYHLCPQCTTTSTILFHIKLQEGIEGKRLPNCVSDEMNEDDFELNALDHVSESDSH